MPREATEPLPTAAFTTVSPRMLRASALTRGPWDPAHQHAGPPIAVACRAIEAAAQAQGLTHIGRLTANLLRRPAGDWICVDARTLLAPNGCGLAESQLFDETGLIGRATQSLAVRARA